MHEYYQDYCGSMRCLLPPKMENVENFIFVDPLRFIFDYINYSHMYFVSTNTFTKLKTENVDNLFNVCIELITLIIFTCILYVWIQLRH